MGIIVTHQKLFEVLSVDNTQWAIQNPQDAIGLMVEAIKNRPQPDEPKAEPLLTFVRTLTVRLDGKLFAVADHFKVDVAATASPKIAYLGDNFKAWFGGHVEQRADETTTVALRFHNLNRNSLDAPIIAEFDGEKGVKTTLRAVWALMKLQPSGQQGALLTNGCANIFYVPDANNVLRAVRVRWFGDGWVVGAYSVEYPDEWRAGHRVFSR